MGLFGGWLGVGRSPPFSDKLVYPRGFAEMAIRVMTLSMCRSFAWLSPEKMGLRLRHPSLLADGLFHSQTAPCRAFAEERSEAPMPRPAILLSTVGEKVAGRGVVPRSARTQGVPSSR